MTRSKVQIIATVAGIATALAAFNILKQCESNTSSVNTPVVGRFTNIEGQVERRLPGSVTMQSVPGPQPIHHQELIVTQRTSVATIVLEPDGPTLRLNENSRFIAEQDGARPGAFTGTILDGTITVLNPGRSGLFRLFREGHEVSPDAINQALVPVIPSAPSGTNAAATTSATPFQGVVITATQADESQAKPTPVARATQPSESNDRTGILTNEDILRTLRGQSGFFQRCFLGHIHRLKSGSVPPGGTIVIGFTVQPSGKVSEAKMVRSEFTDATLHNCVTEVVERTRFKSFEGTPVPVLEFPIVLQ